MTRFTSVMDGRTDGRTKLQLHIPRFAVLRCIASCGKNTLLFDDAVMTHTHPWFMRCKCAYVMTLRREPPGSSAETVQSSGCWFCSRFAYTTNLSIYDMSVAPPCRLFVRDMTLACIRLENFGCIVTDRNGSMKNTVAET